MRKALVTVTGLLLAGCAAAPLPKLDTTVPNTWERTLGGAPKQPDLSAWWKGFGDPLLDARVQAALQGNLALQEAAERLLAARELRAHSRDVYLPWIRGHAGDEITPAATSSYIVTSFDASWEFGLFGRREGTRRELQGAMDDSVAQYAGARVSLVAEVVADHLMLAASQERRTLLAQIEGLRERQTALTRIRQSLSLAAAPDVDAGLVDLGKARLATARGLRQVESVTQELAALLGQMSPDAALRQAAALPVLQGTAPAATPADLLRTRPEIRRAEAAVLQAAGERDLAHSDQWPNVGLVGSIRWSTSIARNNRASSTSYIGAVGPLVDIPLLDWGIRRARTAARGHLLNAAVLAYRDAVLRGIVEVESALGTLQLETERAADAAAAVTARQHMADAATRRRTLQLGSEFDETDARLALAEAQLELVDARAAQGLAYVALYKALGGAPLPTNGQVP